MRPNGNIRLYERLPAHIRTRDAEHGRPLEALMAVLQAEFELLESDIAKLYENWFIETAEEWVVPYIADLLAVRNLRPIESAGFSMRAFVAKTLAYRQGKGTPGVLEQVGSDVTGWQARVVEFFQTLVVSQHVNHIRLANSRRLHTSGTTDIRSASRMQLNDTAFDACAHTAEVRRIATRLGRHNLPNVGLFLWRLEAYFIQRTAARPWEAVPGERCFHFGPLNTDLPLFNRPRDEGDIRHIATERNVPTTIRRLAMDANKGEYLDPSEPVIECFIHGTQLTQDEIIVCHLTWEDAGWVAPTPPADAPDARVAVDPERGRLFLLNAADALFDVETSYTYGFSGDMGGGPYDRNDGEVNDVNERPIQLTVGRDGLFSTLQEAVVAWHADPAGGDGVIAIIDNDSYDAPADPITINDRDLLIIACMPFEAGALEVDATATRPHVRGTIQIIGEGGAGSSCTINGLLIEGNVDVLEGDLGALNVQHCTIMPSFPLTSALPDPLPGASLAVSADAADAEKKNSTLELSVVKSIVGGIALSGPVECLMIEDSVIDGDRRHLGQGAAIHAISAPSTPCTINRSTIWGVADELTEPSMRSLSASESIFTGRVVVERKQEGCVRYSYLPFDSVVPRRFRCQPDLALENVTDAAEGELIKARMRPQFSSTTYGEPDYAQLDRRTDLGVRAGAEDGSEMGAFQFLKQPQREANLLAVLPEYLPFGLQAGPLFIDEADAFRPTGPTVI